MSILIRDDDRVSFDEPDVYLEVDSAYVMDKTQEDEPVVMFFPYVDPDKFMSGLPDDHIVTVRVNGTGGWGGFTITTCGEAFVLDLPDGIQVWNGTPWLHVTMGLPQFRGKVAALRISEEYEQKNQKS